jgi:ABC-type transport system involved in multi-copper enzyme maturation permease subunit
MSTLAIPNASVPSRPVPSEPLAVDAVRAEWTKLRSVRSTYWTLLATGGVMVGISALLCAAYVSRYDRLSALERATFKPVGFSLNGIFLAQLAIGVLGVLVITSEFGTGMIRATLTAMPQRRLVLAAKAAVFAAAAAAVGIASSFAAFFVGQAILAGKGVGVSITQPGALRSVIGAGLYLTVLGLLALGLGTIIRRTAGAIATVFGVVFVLPILVAQLPSSWSDPISKYLPSSAGMALIGGVRGTTTLSPWVGFGLFCVYGAAALGAGAVSFSRRDA